MTDPFLSAAVASLQNSLAPLCKSDRERRCLSILKEQAPNIWAALTKRKKTDGGVRLSPAERAYLAPAVQDHIEAAAPLQEHVRVDDQARTVIEFTGLARTWMRPPAEQRQAQQFLNLLRAIFEIWRALPQQPNIESSAEARSRRKFYFEATADLQAQGRRLDFTAECCAAVGNKYLAELDAQAARSMDKAARFLALRAGQIDLAARRQRTDPRVKALQDAVSAAFEGHFGSPQHEMSAKLTSALLGERTSRDVSRSSRRGIRTAIKTR